MKRLTDERVLQIQEDEGAGRVGNPDYATGDDLDSLFRDHLQAREHVRRLAEELEECMATVAMFHGPAGLALYTQHSPEMKRWRALLAEVAH